MIRSSTLATFVIATVIFLTSIFAQDVHLDLPVHPSNYVGLIPQPCPLPPDDDDPRDETPPVFFGEEIEIDDGVLIYVLDYSCSMEVEQREEKVEAEFVRSVTGLPPSIRFGVITYSCIILEWPVAQATPDAKARAIQFVRGCYPNSGTATGPSVVRGFRLDPACQRVVLLTDGEPNCGAVGLAGHRAMIRNANLQGAVIDVFGIAASGTWRGFCQDVAKDSGGSYTDVP